MVRFLQLLLFISSILACSLFTSCGTIDEVNPICYDHPALNYWTINDIDQVPNFSYEPNANINLDFMFALSRDGAFAMNITNDTFSINWSEDWNLFISNKEMNKVKESEWERLMVERSPMKLPLISDQYSRRELWIHINDTLIIIGDDPGEILHAEVSYHIEKTSECKFLHMSFEALFNNDGDTLDFKISLNDPYVF